jgi:hypothetical protein
MLCVTVGKRADKMKNVPETNLCFRGGGFDERHREFFAQTGKKFRQPVRHHMAASIIIVQCILGLVREHDLES